MPRRTSDANFTTMRLRDLARDRQTESCPMTFFARAGRINLIEPIEQTRQRLALDADA